MHDPQIPLREKILRSYVSALIRKLDEVFQLQMNVAPKSAVDCIALLQLDLAEIPIGVAQ